MVTIILQWPFAYVRRALACNQHAKNIVDGRRWRCHRNVVVRTATVQKIIEKKKMVVRYNKKYS